MAATTSNPLRKKLADCTADDLVARMRTWPSEGLQTHKNARAALRRLTGIDNETAKAFADSGLSWDEFSKKSALPLMDANSANPLEAAIAKDRKPAAAKPKPEAPALDLIKLLTAALKELGVKGDLKWGPRGDYASLMVAGKNAGYVTAQKRNGIRVTPALMPADLKGSGLSGFQPSKRSDSRGITGLFADEKGIAIAAKALKLAAEKQGAAIAAKAEAAQAKKEAAKAKASKAAEAKAAKDAAAEASASRD